MNTGDRIAIRLRRAMEHRGVNQSALSEATGISPGSLSQILNRTIQEKTGKPPVMSLDNLDKACALLAIPAWAVLHQDRAIFDLLLAGDARMAALAAAEPAQALTAAMALVSEVRASAAAPTAEAEIAPPPRRAKAISKPRAPKAKAAPKRRAV